MIKKGAINSIVVSPNGKYLISGSQDRSVQIFDFETKRTIHQYHYIEDGIYNFIEKRIIALIF